MAGRATHAPPRGRESVRERTLQGDINTKLSLYMLRLPFGQGRGEGEGKRGERMHKRETEIYPKIKLVSNY